MQIKDLLFLAFWCSPFYQERWIWHLFHHFHFIRSCFYTWCLCLWSGPYRVQNSPEAHQNKSAPPISCWGFWPANRCEAPCTNLQRFMSIQCWYFFLKSNSVQYFFLELYWIESTTIFGRNKCLFWSFLLGMTRNQVVSFWISEKRERTKVVSTISAMTSLTEIFNTS